MYIQLQYRGTTYAGKLIGRENEFFVAEVYADNTGELIDLVLVLPEDIAYESDEEYHNYLKTLA